MISSLLSSALLARGLFSGLLSDPEGDLATRPADASASARLALTMNIVRPLLSSWSSLSLSSSCCPQFHCVRGQRLCCWSATTTATTTTTTLAPPVTGSSAVLVWDTCAHVVGTDAPVHFANERNVVFVCFNCCVIQTVSYQTCRCR